MNGLVLSGGGARGAYQAGVISALSEIAAELGQSEAFSIYSGVSAGAINATYLASQAHNFAMGTERLINLWANITSDKVFRTDPISLSSIGMKWVRDLSLGGLTHMSSGPGLMDTAPLRDLLFEHIDFQQIEHNIENKSLYALALTAVDYHTSMAVTFIQGQEDHPTWTRSRRFSEKAKIQTDHIMASSAIPILFPPIKVEERFYGDGCVRNLAPLSPAIHLGASKIVVIGVRRQTDVQMAMKSNPPKNVSIARVANVLLNAILLDGVEVDVDRLNRINDFVDKVPSTARDVNFKKVDVVSIYPTRDIGQMAHDNARRLPAFVRYLLKGLGTTEDSKEIISYLLFEKEFTSQLIEMGYKDGMANKEKVRALLG